MEAIDNGDATTTAANRRRRRRDAAKSRPDDDDHDGDDATRTTATRRRQLHSVSVRSHHVPQSNPVQRHVFCMGAHKILTTYNGAMPHEYSETDLDVMSLFDVDWGKFP